MWIRTPRLVAGLASALLVTAAAFAPAASAHTDARSSTSATSGAAVSLALCTGSVHSTFDPAVTDTPTSIYGTTAASYTCVLPLLESVTRSGGGGTTVLSCDSLLEALPGSAVLHWGDGSTSTYAYTTDLTAVDGVTVATQTGQITAGRYAGATVVETISLGSLDLTACAGAGISSVDYLATLTVVGI